MPIKIRQTITANHCAYSDKQTCSQTKHLIVFLLLPPLILLKQSRQQLGGHEN